MKKGLKAILLAAGLTVSMFGTCVFAEEDSTEAVTEAVTEAASEAEAVSEAAEAVEEAASEVEAEAEAASEEEAGGAYAAYYDSMKSSIVQTLQALSAMPDEQLNQAIEDSTNASEKAMLATWQSMKDELGNFVEVTEQTVTEEGTVITINSTASYDGVEKNAPVEVVYEYNVKDGTASLNWNVDYPMSTLLTQAALNTVMGVGIVFLVLLFLSFLISQLHWIPDLLNRKEKEKAAAQAAAPAPAPAAAPVVEEEEELADDLELVAVISAAIAASENTSADGFVVRSIKKANRRKWQNA